LHGKAVDADGLAVGGAVGVVHGPGDGVGGAVDDGGAGGDVAVHVHGHGLCGLAVVHQPGNLAALDGYDFFIINA
jgi:hypothetical protein